MKNNQVNFRLNKETINHLSRYKSVFLRGELSKQIREDLGIHEQMLKYELQELSGTLSRSEAEFLFDILLKADFDVVKNYKFLPGMLHSELSFYRGLFPEDITEELFIDKIDYFNPITIYTIIHLARLYELTESVEDQDILFYHFLRCYDLRTKKSDQQPQKK